MAVRLSSRQKIRKSLLRLAAQKSQDQIDIACLASDSGVSVEEITSLYGSLQDVFWEIISQLDQETLLSEELTSEESMHDKLFDLLMKQFESLQNQKSSLQYLAKSIEKSSFSSLYVNHDVVKAMGWILETAGGDISGLDGEARKRALAWVFGNTFETFLQEDDPGLSKTMMVLDRSLSRIVLWQERFGGAVNILKGAGAILGYFIDNLQKRGQEDSKSQMPQSGVEEDSTK